MTPAELAGLEKEEESRREEHQRKLSRPEVGMAVSTKCCFCCFSRASNFAEKKLIRVMERVAAEM